MSRLPTQEEILRTRDLAQADLDGRRARELAWEGELVDAGKECWEMIGDFVTRARELGVKPSTWQSPEHGGQASRIVWVEGYPLTNGAIASAPPLRYCVAAPRNLRRPQLMVFELEELALFTAPVGDESGAAAAVREHQTVSRGSWPRIARLEHMYAFQHAFRHELETSLLALTADTHDSDPPSPTNPAEQTPLKPAAGDADDRKAMAKPEVSDQPRVTGGRWVREAPGTAKADTETAPAAGNTESRPPRPSLGRLVVEAGVASEPQVKFATAEGLETGEKLGEVLVRRGWATEEVLAELLAEQWQLPFSTRAELSIDPAATELIPLTHARELGALPIGFEGDRVLVAITEPTQDLLNAVAARFKQPSFVVVSRSDLHSLLTQLAPVNETTQDPEPIEADTSEAHDDRENAIPAQADAPAAETAGPLNSVDQPASGAVGMLAANTLSSLEAAMGELQRIHREVAALGKSLELAREQLTEANAELEAVAEDNEQHVATIQQLESDRSKQAHLLETLRAQAATLNETLTTHPAT